MRQSGCRGRWAADGNESARGDNQQKNLSASEADSAQINALDIVLQQRVTVHVESGRTGARHAAQKIVFNTSFAPKYRADEIPFGRSAIDFRHRRQFAERTFVPGEPDAEDEVMCQSDQRPIGGPPGARGRSHQGEIYRAAEAEGQELHRFQHYKLPGECRIDVRVPEGQFGASDQTNILVESPLRDDPRRWVRSEEKRLKRHLK